MISYRVAAIFLAITLPTTSFASDLTFKKVIKSVKSTLGASINVQAANYDKVLKMTQNNGSGSQGAQGMDAGGGLAANIQWMKANGIEMSMKNGNSGAEQYVQKLNNSTGASLNAQYIDATYVQMTQERGSGAQTIQKMTIN